MLALELLGLFLVAAGAIYGIWSKADRDITVATVSTAIAALGLLGAAGLAIWKSRRAVRAGELAERRRQSEIQALMAATPLSAVEIAWSFDNVPQDVLQIVTLGDLIVDTAFLRDDERDRQPAEVRERAKRAWHLESAVFPLLHVIDTGSLDPQMYEGEAAAEAIRRWEARDNNGWRDNVGSTIRYVGPQPELIFPLNPRSNAVLSLGGTDDVALEKAEFGWQEDDPSLFLETNYGFNAFVEQHESELKLTWNYDHASLSRAVERDAGAELCASLPAAFNFLIVRKRLEKEEYLAKAARTIKSMGDGSEDHNADIDWTARSKLTIHVNGLPDPHYEYDVSKVRTATLTTDQGAYDAPETEFEYTRFEARLTSL